MTAGKAISRVGALGGVGTRERGPTRPARATWGNARSRLEVDAMTSEEASALRARNVSFSPTQDYIQLADAPEEDALPPASASRRSSVLAASPKKSALKPGRQTPLPPAGHYQHPDPLVRRLRLVDAKGNPVNLKQELRETQLLLFYFGSQWNAQFNKGCSAVRVSCTYPARDGREPRLPS